MTDKKNGTKKKRRGTRIIPYYGSELRIAEIAKLEGISYARAYDKYARQSSKFSQLEGQTSLL